MIAGRTNDAGEACGFGGCRFNRPGPVRLVYQPCTETQPGPDQGANHWFFRAARGFRAPQATELYRLQNGQSVSNIDSESIDSVELGVRRVTAYYAAAALTVCERTNSFSWIPAAPMLITAKPNIEVRDKWRYAVTERLTVIGAGGGSAHLQ